MPVSSSFVEFRMENRIKSSLLIFPWPSFYLAFILSSLYTPIYKNICVAVLEIWVAVSVLTLLINFYFI